MNPELAVSPDVTLYVACLLILGALSVGFLIGYLTKNFLVDKKIKEIENLLEKRFGRELDEFFEDVY